MPPVVEPRAALRAASLRVTAPRMAVLAAVQEHPHADAAQVARAVRLRLGSVSTQTVYDVLHALAGAGLIRQIEPAGSPARYEIRRGDNHHHLVCRNCGIICDVACSVDTVPCLEAASTRGFVIDEAEVTFWGLCRECVGGAERPSDVSGGGLEPPRPLGH